MKCLVIKNHVKYLYKLWIIVIDFFSIVTICIIIAHYYTCVLQVSFGLYQCIFVGQNGQRQHLKNRMVRMERLLAPVPITEYRRNPPTLATRLCKSIFWRILCALSSLYEWFKQKKNINNILPHHNTVGTRYTIVHIHYTMFVNNSLSCLTS